MAINTESQGYQGSANGRASSNSGGQVFTHAGKMFTEARALGGAIGNTATSLNQALDLHNRVQRNPIGMVCAAAGVGYVLGGGLFSSTTSRLLKVGVRLALIPFVKSQLSALAGNAGRRAGSSMGGGAGTGMGGSVGSMP